MKKQLVIYGASGHARTVTDIIRLQNEYEIVGYLDDTNTSGYGKAYCNATLLGGGKQLKNLRQRGIEYILFGFGNCVKRLQLSDQAKTMGFSLASAIHPRAIIADDVEIGAGTVVAAGAIINPGSRVGENVIINTGAIIDHNCLIHSGAHISPGVCLAGGVTVEEAAWIGIGASVTNGIIIGSKTIIGAGAVVVKNIPAGVIAYGVPARVSKEVEIND